MLILNLTSLLTKPTLPLNPIYLPEAHTKLAFHDDWLCVHEGLALDFLVWSAVLQRSKGQLNKI